MAVVIYRLIPAGGFYFKLFSYYLKILICCSLSWISDIFLNSNSCLCSPFHLSSQHCSTHTAYLMAFGDFLFKCSRNILQIRTCTSMRLYSTHFLPALGPRAGCNSGKIICLFVYLAVWPNSCDVKSYEKSHAVSCQDLVFLV